jgi:predicted alpha/beta hydrolase family esterase
MPLTKVVIVPGNGEGCASANFYPTLASSLRAAGFPVELREMPDPGTARESIWLPFITDVLHADENTLLVGHSSGAVAGLRLAENVRLGALVVVSVTPTDLGDANERASGYYNRDWQWARIRANVPTVAMFASLDDPFIPIALQRTARQGLQDAAAPEGHTFAYHELEAKSHFFAAQQKEITECCLQILAGGK